VLETPLSDSLVSQQSRHHQADAADLLMTPSTCFTSPISQHCVPVAACLFYDFAQSMYVTSLRLCRLTLLCHSNFCVVAAD